MTDLETQVSDGSNEVHTESYSMSIGEIKNIYEEKELDLHPEFQRFFRWTDEQKYKLIESILLGIPLPSFFVAQNKSGIWDVVDGLQRLSTIFEFMGVLRDENGEKLPPLQMQATKYLPALKGMKWDNPDDTGFQIPETIKRDFKRKKLDINILLKNSDESTKYELFERLNTGGSSATSQEVRNAILVRDNKNVFDTLTTFANYEPFIDTTLLSETNIDERYDLELITRFILLRNIDLTVLSTISVNDYLTDELISKASKGAFNWEEEEEIFQKTFILIYGSLGGNAFKKYSTKKGRFEGGFVVSAFEVVALGIAYNIARNNLNNIEGKVKKFWDDREERKVGWHGRNTTNRLQITLKYGRELFQ